MHPVELQRCLSSLVLLVDTREQPTESLKRRIEATGFPHERCKLDFGDYSCKCVLPGGEALDFSSKIAIERKMSLDELCLCFGKERGRFEREFERAKIAGCRVYLLVENATWENAYNGKYRSLLNPKALIASIDAYRARYDMRLDFCKAETTGKRIRDILYRESKEYIEGLYM